MNSLSSTFKAKLLATLLASSSALSHTPVWGGDDFIVQPKLQRTNKSSFQTRIEPPNPQRTFSGGRETESSNQTLLQPPSRLTSPRPSEQTPQSGELSESTLRWVTRGTAQQSVEAEAPSLNFQSTSLFTPVRPLNFNSTIPTVRIAGRSDAAQASVEEKPSEETRRAKLASLVSNQIISGGSSTESDLPSVQPVDAPPGWQSIGETLSRHLAACESLLKRNAFFSARAEAEQAMLHLVRVLDLMENRYNSEPAWQAAQQALNEAEDFAMVQRLVTDKSLLQRIVNSHETPVLQNADMEELAPMTAAQHYRLYAEMSLIEASQQHPWASDVFYSIGRTFQAQADSGDNNAESLRWEAATFYRAACAVAPNNAIAANQLGYIMLQMDRPVDAKNALLASITSSPSAASLQNLMEATRRLGDSATYEWASRNLTALNSRQPMPSAAPPFVEVDPRTFAAMSPYAGGPVPTLASPRTAGIPPTQR